MIRHITGYVSNKDHRKTFIVLWLTYSSFYLCRVNLSIAIPKIVEELNFSLSDMGILGSVFFIIYAAGQILNGILSSRYSPRTIIITGIAGSAVVNILFGMSKLLSLMIVLWMLNAYFQSAGWAPAVRIISNWFSSKKTGVISGLFGASYHFGNAISWLIAGSIALFFSWRALFFIPSVLFLLSGLHFFIFVRDTPEDNIILRQGDKRKHTTTPVKEFLDIIKKPRILQIAMASMFLSVMAYGVQYWIPSYLYKERCMSISIASFNALCFPLAGSLGVIVAGWATDKFFNSKRAPVILIMISTAIVLTFLFPYLSGVNRVFTVPLLLLMGFMIDGPHILFGMALPIDYEKERASMVAGFINSMNYFGSAAGIFAAGRLINGYGWNAVFYLWVCSLFLSTIIVAMILSKEKGVVSKNMEVRNGNGA